MIHTDWDAELVHKCSHQEVANIRMSIVISALLKSKVVVLWAKIPTFKGGYFLICL